jgi:hypothetical protein
MTEVILLIFSKDKKAIERVKNTIIPTLKRELDNKTKAGETKYSEEHKNFYCYINTEVGKEFGSIPIPQGFYEEPKQFPMKIELKKAKEGDKDV